MKNLVTHERLLAKIKYDPSTGAFQRLLHGKWVATGYPVRGGYICVYVDGRAYSAARLAWFWMTGEWPDREVDHRNVMPSDNRWMNLRLAKPTQNCANKHRYKHNTSGFKGVSRLVVRGKFVGWRARIGVEKKRLSLGVFGTPEEAHQAYCAASEQMHREYSRTF